MYKSVDWMSSEHQHSFDSIADAVEFFSENYWVKIIKREKVDETNLVWLGLTEITSDDPANLFEDVPDTLIVLTEIA